VKNNKSHCIPMTTSKQIWTLIDPRCCCSSMHLCFVASMLAFGVLLCYVLLAFVPSSAPLRSHLLYLHRWAVIFCFPCSSKKLGQFSLIDITSFLWQKLLYTLNHFFPIVLISHLWSVVMHLIFFYYFAYYWCNFLFISKLDRVILEFLWVEHQIE
jgi:hypothetical protein